MTDNLYPNAGDDFDTTYYPEDPKPSEKDAQNNTAIATSLPIMGNIARWFEEQIYNCDSINNIKIEAHTINGIKYTRKVSIEGQLLAYQMLKQLLDDKYQEFNKFSEDANG